jgi:hypothetical protein
MLPWQPLNRSGKKTLKINQLVCSILDVPHDMFKLSHIVLPSITSDKVKKMILVETDIKFKTKPSSVFGFEA